MLKSGDKIGIWVIITDILKNGSDPKNWEFRVRSDENAIWNIILEDMYLEGQRLEVGDRILVKATLVKFNKVLKDLYFEVLDRRKDFPEFWWASLRYISIYPEF